MQLPLRCAALSPPPAGPVKSTPARQQQPLRPQAAAAKHRAAPASAAAAAEVAATPDGSSFTFSTLMSVRDYELDQFSVVNNAVYSNYIQHGAADTLWIAPCVAACALVH